jgi:multidrug transporter EmrE-like cation transporter
MLTSTESTSLLKPEHASSYASLTDATSLIQSESGSSSSYSSYSSLTDALPDAVELGEAPQHLEGTRKAAGPRDCHLGLLCVTTSSFLFGLVAALVKLVALEPYVMLQVRGSLQWLLSLVAVGACVKTSTTTAARFFGEPRQRPILLLRSGLYWTYVSLWWHALAGMPVGDATAMVYCAPLLTALFGWLLLGERVPPKVFGCLALSLVGVGLITRPTFLFGHGTNGAEYSRGALCACGSAASRLLVPVRSSPQPPLPCGRWGAAARNPGKSQRRGRASRTSASSSCWDWWPWWALPPSGCRRSGTSGSGRRGHPR